jgi:peptide deformylase
MDLSQIDLASLSVVKYPDPRLRRPCQTITQFDAALAALARRMCQIMYQTKGVGLAAPQVGLALRLFVINPTGDPAQPEFESAYVNGRIVSRDGSLTTEEGCLSVPGLSVRIKRAAKVTLEAADLQGQVRQYPAEGLLARIFQHETDHIENTIIADRMSAVAKLSLSNRQLLKDLEEEFQEQQ